jgi:SAM-dependent methyltransferase
MGTGHDSTPAPSPGLIFNTLLAFQQTEALRAGIELDLFRAVGEGPGDVASLARQCQASERGIRILCDYLTIHGFLLKEGDRYRHTPTSELFLDPRSPACIASISRFLGDPQTHDVAKRLPEIVRSGRTLLPGGGTVDPDHPVWVEFAHSMAPMMAPMAAPVGSLVLEGFTGPVEVLDIAAGHGLFGIGIAKLNLQAQIVAVDWAKVLEVARSNAEKAGVGDRFHTLPGSAFEVEFGGPYDIALLTNFLHHFDHPTCVGILKKIHGSLKHGGRVAALEFVPNEDRVSPPIPAAFSLTMLISTPSGDAYTLSELKKMYHEAGFADVKGQPVPNGPQTLVSGTRA